MAALTITAGNVGMGAGANSVTVTYGETVTQGEPLRKDSSTGKYLLCNHATEAEAEAECIALTPGDDGDSGAVLFKGNIVEIGATVAIGTAYVVGPTDGDVNPLGDLASADYVSIVGHAVSTSAIKLTFDVLGVAVA